MGVRVSSSSLRKPTLRKTLERVSSTNIETNIPAEIAQLVEHNLAKVGVASSSLVFRSSFRHSFFHSILCIRGREVSDTFFISPPYHRQHQTTQRHSTKTQETLTLSIHYQQQVIQRRSTKTQETLTLSISLPATGDTTTLIKDSAYIEWHTYY